MLMPQNHDFCSLRVISAEFGLRGRADLAQILAEEIAAAL
jgi:hypothetical protein